MADDRCDAPFDRGNCRRDSESACRPESASVSVQFVLASSSASRRTMLEAAGVPFTIAVPSIEEDVIKSLLTDGGSDGYRIADELAQAKAVSVSVRMREAFVLGADQVLVW